MLSRAVLPRRWPIRSRPNDTSPWNGSVPRETRPRESVFQESVFQESVFQESVFQETGPRGTGPWPSSG